jgi:hypothetical protein
MGRHIFPQDCVVRIGEGESAYMGVVLCGGKKDKDLVVTRIQGGNMVKVRVAHGVHVEQWLGASGQNFTGLKGLIVAEACEMNPDWLQVQPYRFIDEEAMHDFMVNVAETIDYSEILKDEEMVREVVLHGVMNFPFMQLFIDECKHVLALFRRLVVGDLDNETRTYLISKIDQDRLFYYTDKLFEEVFSAASKSRLKEKAHIVDLIQILIAEMDDETIVSFMKKLIGIELNPAMSGLGIISGIKKKGTKHIQALCNLAINDSATRKHPWLDDIVKAIAFDIEDVETSRYILDHIDEDARPCTLQAIMSAIDDRIAYWERAATQGHTLFQRTFAILVYYASHPRTDLRVELDHTQIDGIKKILWGELMNKVSTHDVRIEIQSMLDRKQVELTRAEGGIELA